MSRSPNHDARSRKLPPHKKERKPPPSSSTLESVRSLQDVAIRRNNWLPVRVKVTKKRTLDSKWNFIVIGDLYNIFSVKDEKTVTFNVPMEGTFTLPIGTDVKCSLVYSTEPENLEKSLAGYTFKKVSDIAKALPRPKIVCATRLGSGRSIKSGIIPGEVLRIVEVQTDNQHISAYSYTLECPKQLDGECTGNFTTKPADVQLPLSQLLTDFDLTFPCYVQLFPASGSGRKVGGTLPPRAFSTILSMSAPPSSCPHLIATSTSGLNRNKVVEIPVTADIEVAIVEVCGKELLELKAQSAKLLNKEVCQDVTDSPRVTSPRESMEVPQQTYMSLNAPSSRPEPQGIYADATISAGSDKPAKSVAPAGNIPARETSLPAPRTSNSATWASMSNVPASTLVDSSMPRKVEALTPPAPPQPKEKAEPPLDSVSRFAGPPLVAALEERLKYKRHSRDSAITQISLSGDSATDTDVETLRLRYAEVKDELEKCQSSLRVYQDALETTQKEVNHLKSDVEFIFTKLGCSKEAEETERVAVSQNKSRLATFTTEEVIQLLEALGLPQYKKKFATERITGKLLLQCNDKMLEKELGVSNKVHRLQLMTVVEGKCCAYSIVTKT